MLSSGPAHAQTQWTGATSTNWFTAGNWNPAAVPGAATDVNINTNATPNAPTVAAAGGVARNAALGTAAGTTGTLTISGAGRLTTSQFLGGDVGTGVLNITGGGQLLTQSFTNLGNNVGATGSATITDAGSLWTVNFPYFKIGDSGSGTMNVLAGGRVTSPFTLEVATDNGATGDVLVSGAASRINVGAVIIGNSQDGVTLVTSDGSVQISDTGLLASTGTITVGSVGLGALTIDTGGDATASSLVVGARAVGTATITGAGSTMAATSAVTVGQQNGGNGTLNVEAGAVVTSATGAIGTQTGAVGDANVTGANSRWTMTSTLQIGQAAASGTGRLDIMNGGRVDASAFTGFNSARVTVDGANSQLNLLGAPVTTFTMGATGANNRLDVTAGGALATKAANLATVAGTGVTVTVDGQNSTWTANSITLGGAGTNAMTVSNNAAVTSTGDFTVDGSANTTLTISSGGRVTHNPDAPTGGQFRLGVNGQGTLRIESGGVLETNPHPTPGFGSFTFFGRNAGSTAAATITGAGSTWASHGSVIIGSAGTATMDILAGGTVTGESGADIGFLAGSNGSVLVSGANSAWLLSEPAPLAGLSNISVGIGGTGALRIEDGARVAAQGVGVGSAQDTNTPGTGTLVVTGAGTRLDLNVGTFQTFDAGSDGGTGTIDVLAGAVVTVVGQGHFGRSSVFTGQVPTQALGNGTLTVDGTGSRVTFTQTLDIGEQATGVLNVQNGGFVSNSDGYLGSFTNALGSAGVGTATVTGAGSTWQNSGFLRVGDQGTGTLNVLAGGVVTNTNAIMANAAGTTGTATVDGAGSAWTGTGTLAVGNLGTATLNIRNGGTVTAPGGVSINNLSTLNIGSGGAAGTLNAPTVASAGLVRFNHTGATTFAAAISGAGTVTKDAAGTTTLTGDSTYTGTTTINAGAVQLGAGGTTGGITGNITNNAALIINRSNAFNYGGSIGGTGTLTHNGTGTTTLGGVNGYNGATTINAGTLNVNGSITNSTVTVNAAGTLGGTGTVGPTTVAGNIAPGNSIGTLNIAGPYVQTTGSTYTVELNTTTADLLNVTGTATIQAGTTVSVLPAPGFYTLGQRYTILTATGGVTGQYTTLTDNAPFVDFELDSDANNIFLDVIRSSVSFQEIAQTRNQRASAGGVEALGPGNVIFDAVVMLDALNARRAFDLLSGEIHASIAGTMLEDSRFIRNAVTGRLQSIGGTAAIFAPRFAALNFAEDGADVETASLMFDNALGYAPEKRKRVRDTMDRALPMQAAPRTTGRVFAAWGQAFGSWGSSDGDGNAAALSRSTGGFITGLDVTFPGGRDGDVWRAGLAGGYQYTSINVGDRNSSGRIDTYHLAAYGGRQIGPLGLRAGASYGRHDISTSRSIVFPGFSDTTKANYDAGTAQVFGEIGYALPYRQFALEPFAGLAYVSIRTAGFAEAGGAAALAGTGRTSDTTTSTVGLRAASALPWRDLSGLTAKASAAWRHAFGTVTPIAQLGFVSGTTPFVVAGTPIARDAAALEVGLEGAVARGATLSVAYTGQVAGHADDHGITANYVQRF